MADRDRPAAYENEELVQQHRCPLGCNIRVVSRPGHDVEIWSHDHLSLALRVNPHNREPWLIPALTRAIAHARSEPEPDQPTTFFSDLGCSLVRFQGGDILLRGFGCGRCGNGHWAEDDRSRRRPVGTLAPCPHCGKPSVLPEVERG